MRYTQLYLYYLVWGNISVKYPTARQLWYGIAPTGSIFFQLVKHDENIDLIGSVFRGNTDKYNS